MAWLSVKRCVFSSKKNTQKLRQQIVSSWIRQLIPLINKTRKMKNKLINTAAPTANIDSCKIYYVESNTSMYSVWNINCVTL